MNKHKKYRFSWYNWLKIGTFYVSGSLFLELELELF